MGKKTKDPNVIAFWLATASSLFLFLSGTTGVSGLTQIEEIAFKYANLPYMNILFVLAFIFASFGGITVLIGGILILKNKVTFGDLLIALGSGAGIISFLFTLFISSKAANVPIYSHLSFSSLGVIFALAAQFMSRTKKKRKKKP